MKLADIRVGSYFKLPEHPMRFCKIHVCQVTPGWTTSVRIQALCIDEQSRLSLWELDDDEEVIPGD
jgi:hypothetical protein